MDGVRNELIVFVIACLSGAFLRLVYQFMECFRKIVRHHTLLTGMEDIFFWLFFTIYLFVQIHQTSNGSIRWYFLLGVVVGAVIISAIVRKIKKLAKKIYKTKP